MSEYMSQLQPAPDLSDAVKIACPVCQAYAGQICGLCGGSKVALMLPGGALFKVPEGVE